MSVISQLGDVNNQFKLSIDRSMDNFLIINWFVAASTFKAKPKQQNRRRKRIGQSV
jgi:hypothetical protein